VGNTPGKQDKIYLSMKKSGVELQRDSKIVPLLKASTGKDTGST